jgi:hypothetical protein
MTITEIVQAAADRTGITSAEGLARLLGTANRYYRRLTSSLGIASVSKRAVVQADATMGVRTLTFTGVEKVISVQDRSTGTIRTLEPVSVEEIDESSVGTGLPTKYSIYRMGPGSVTIYLNTVPQSAFTLYADGYEQTDTLADAQEPAFPESFHDCLVEAAVYEERLKQEKGDLAKAAKLEYEQRVSDLRMFIATSAMQDIHQGKRATGSIGGGSGSGSESIPNGAASYTQTGLITFDRDPSAPFAVADDSAVVANLDADLLDGEEGSAYHNASNLNAGTVPLARLSGITNAEIAALAAIAYSKLNLSASIVNADIANAAAIAWSKISKTGSSLADLTTRSAADLSSGIIPDARIPGFTSDGASRISRLAFLAAQSASSDANTLDDYEEGTWTPVIGGSGGTSGQSYSSQAGRYIKVGKQVTVTFDVTLTNKGTITTNVQIQGLPFTIQNSTGAGGVMSLYWENLGANRVALIAIGGVNTTTATLFGATAAAASLSALATADITNTTRFIGSLTYEASA